MTGSKCYWGRSRRCKKKAANIINNKQAIYGCVTELNNIEVDKTKDLHIVMLMHNLIKYNNNYSKASGSVYQFCRDKLNDNVTDSESFKFK